MLDNVVAKELKRKATQLTRAISETARNNNIPNYEVACVRQRRTYNVTKVVIVRQPTETYMQKETYEPNLVKTDFAKFRQ